MSDRYKKIILSVTIFLISFICTLAQEEAHNEIWGTFTIRQFSSKKHYWFRHDLGLRPSYTEYPSTLFQVRTRMVISIGSYLNFQPGVEYRYENNKHFNNNSEIRTFQGVQLDWPNIKRFMFDHFYRFEQRFHFAQGQVGSELGLRSRYRLRLRIPINKNVVSNNTFYTDLRVEAFVPHDSNIQELFANTVRLGAVLGYNQSKKWRYFVAAYIDRGKNTIEENRSDEKYIFSFTIRRTFQ